jgi:Fur family iron response transcriptional regulator
MSTLVMNRQEAENLLRARGLQPTSQRVEVLYLLHLAGQHMAADDVHARLNLEYSRASRATVYNVLNLFKAHGLVTEVIIEPGKVLYDPNVQPHYHFYNTSTHELSDVSIDTVGFLCLPMLPLGTTFQGVDVIIRIAQEP